MGRSTDKLKASIKAIMTTRRYSIQELANMSGLSYGAIYKFLTTESYQMSLNNIERIADALDLTVSGLINWRAKP